MRGVCSYDFSLRARGKARYFPSLNMVIYFYFEAAMT
jgi:hypothetical protein